MKFVYRNRRGDSYYLKSGLTSKGNKKYYLSKEITTDDLEAVPDGYEVFENVHGGVFVRKIRNSILLSSEKELLDKCVSPYERKVRYEEQGKSIVFHCAITSLLGGKESLASLAFSSGSLDIDKFENYTKMLRFELIDLKCRLFATYRWYTRNTKEYWLEIGEPNALKNQIDKYLHHIEKNSFYELH